MNICVECKYCQMGTFCSEKYYLCKSKPLVKESKNPVTGEKIYAQYDYCANINKDGNCGQFEEVE